MTDEDLSDLGERLVEAVIRVTGDHPGSRALHAKGIGATGRFVAGADAGALTKARHLQPGIESPVTVRFSNGSGNPGQPDGARDGRGCAVKFHLPDDSSTDLVALTLPVFFVRNPEDFLAFLAAREPDPSTGETDLNRVLAFLSDHPEAQRAAELSIAAAAPVSYATTRYFGIHAFWWVGPDGARTKVRYHWEPSAGVEVLSDDSAADRSSGYLGDELSSRLSAGTVAFTLIMTLGTEADDETDPTTEWPAERTTLVAGRLEVTDLARDPSVVEHMIFDPTRLCEGFEVSADLILHGRSVAYGASYARRTS